MGPISVTKVAEAVVRRAQRQGFIVAGDVRTELRVAGLPETQWKTVVSEAGSHLHHRQGRYYHKDANSERLEQERVQQRAIQKAIRALIKEHRARQRPQERRGQARVDFIQPVAIQAEDGKRRQFLSRDISLTGIRLLGTQHLLGQKVQIILPQNGGTTCSVLTRILWTCSVGDGLFENGGSFVELVHEPEA